MSKHLHVKYPLFLSDFNKILILSTDFLKKAQVLSFVKTRPVGAELFHADGRTDMTKLIVAFRNFANAPKTRLWNIRTFLWLPPGYFSEHWAGEQRFGYQQV